MIDTALQIQNPPLGRVGLTDLLDCIRLLEFSIEKANGEICERGRDIDKAVIDNLRFRCHLVRFAAVNQGTVTSIEKEGARYLSERRKARKTAGT